jgi:hypothetical protein
LPDEIEDELTTGCRIFEKSINCIETINGAAADVDAARFQWHIGGIASFQAIMHVLSELRNPLFDTPDRQRALRALQMSRILRANNSAKAWVAVRNMIDHAIAEHEASPRSASLSSGYVSPPENFSNGNVRVYGAMGEIPRYALQVSSGTYEPDPCTAAPQQTQSAPSFVPPLQQMQDTVQPNWDDLNLNHINNIVGDVQPTPGVMPDFDFVSPFGNMGNWY